MHNYFLFLIFSFWEQCFQRNNKTVSNKTREDQFQDSSLCRCGRFYGIICIFRL